MLINFLDKEGHWHAFAKGVDWRLVPAVILILFALWILAALALACSTRLEMIPTLAICSVFFLLGLMSDYMFGRRSEPAWVTFDLKQEVRRSKWSDGQIRLLRETVEKHDANKNGKLDVEERNRVTADEQKRLANAGLGGAVWASILYTVVPNWQLFWLADALENKKTIPWRYVGQAFGYVVAYLGASLAIALVLFEDRELS